MATCQTSPLTLRDALEGGEVPPPPPMAPSLCPATVPLTASASCNGICKAKSPVVVPVTSCCATFSVAGMILDVLGVDSQSI